MASRSASGRTARAIVMHEHGGPEVLKLEEHVLPPVTSGRVEVDVAAAGVNFMDVYHRRGDYDVSLPSVPGIEGAGTVTAVGPDVHDVAVGTRVAFMRPIVDPGAYCEGAVVERSNLVVLPDTITLELAAAVLVQGVSAHYLVRDAYAIRDGDSVLVHAAAGGLGLLLVQLGKRAGATVIGTVSSEAKAQMARAAGADATINYSHEDIATRVLELTGGEGVHVVYDGVGAATLDASIASLRPRGTLAVFGTPSGDIPPLDTWRLWEKSLKFTRPQVKHHTGPDELPRRAAEIFDAVARRDLHVRIDSVYPLEEAAQAQERIEGRRSMGKILVLPKDS